MPLPLWFGRTLKRNFAFKILMGQGTLKILFENRKTNPIKLQLEYIFKKKPFYTKTANEHLLLKNVYKICMKKRIGQRW